MRRSELKRITRTILLASLFLAVFILLVVGQTQSIHAQVESTIPESLFSCLPQSAEQIELLGQVHQDQSEIYLLGVQDDRYWESLVLLDAAGCLVIKGRHDTEPLSAYIPLELAQQVALQRYQRRIAEAGGLEAFQRGFAAHMTQQFPEERVYLAPENIWALQQLGVEIPEGTYQIRYPRTEPNLNSGEELL